MWDLINTRMAYKTKLKYPVSLISFYTESSLILGTDDKRIIILDTENFSEKMSYSFYRTGVSALQLINSCSFIVGTENGEAHLFNIGPKESEAKNNEGSPEENKTNGESLLETQEEALKKKRDLVYRVIKFKAHSARVKAAKYVEFKGEGFLTTCSTNVSV